MEGKGNDSARHCAMLCDDAGEALDQAVLVLGRLTLWARVHPAELPPRLLTAAVRLGNDMSDLLAELYEFTEDTQCRIELPQSSATILAFPRRSRNSPKLVSSLARAERGTEKQDEGSSSPECAEQEGKADDER
ncbi:hypothetical protein [Allokutzneria albata]|uniref:Uncharacterized protein n=1 Tax=Allokutzneria albata TaxID=211114 RepID=A0A1G9YBY8_ALLAB|nr:hypothetical protein [Allokutzneria albata]SDN06166.1 hypothetical protein SAMN04489726_4705 [Allokutzneria albata]